MSCRYRKPISIQQCRSSGRASFLEIFSTGSSSQLRLVKTAMAASTQNMVCPTVACAVEMAGGRK